MSDPSQTIHGVKRAYGRALGCYLDQDTRYDKIVEAMGGHGELVEHPDQIRPALERAYAATLEGRVACVNVISEPMEQMVTRSNRASALMGY